MNTPSHTPRHPSQQNTPPARTGFVPTALALAVAGCFLPAAQAVPPGTTIWVDG